VYYLVLAHLVRLHDSLGLSFFKYFIGCHVGYSSYLVFNLPDESGVLGY
jgi:hypothetical protein